MVQGMQCFFRHHRWRSIWYLWLWWLINKLKRVESSKQTNSGNSAAACWAGASPHSNKSNHHAQKKKKTRAIIRWAGPPPEPQQGGLLLARAILPALGFCWPVRCCCWLALWLPFGLGNIWSNFLWTISAFYFIKECWSGFLLYKECWI